MLESPQALVVAGLVLLVTVSIVQWKTHPVSDGWRHYSDACFSDEALIVITWAVEVHSHRGRILGPRTVDLDCAELHAEWEGVASRGVQ